MSKKAVSTNGPSNKKQVQDSKPKQEMDENKLDPKELPIGDTTSAFGEKNIVGVHGCDGSKTEYDVDKKDPEQPVR